MESTLKILGCGSSAGVPAIGNWWGACNPEEPRNYRTRPSILLETASTSIVVDTGPDYREQMNLHDLRCPDAIIFTHAHSDHINGIDELRTLQRRFKRQFPAYADQATMETLLRRFDYMFQTSEDGFYATVCLPNTLEMGIETTIGDIAFTPFEQNHGSIKSLGLRIGSIGYSTDVKSLNDNAYKALEGIDTWIVDAAAYHDDNNPVHASINLVIAMNERIGASKVILTHLPPTMDYKILLSELPEGYIPAYDGMTLEI